MQETKPGAKPTLSRFPKVSIRPGTQEALAEKKDLLLIIGPFSDLFDKVAKGIEREVGDSYKLQYKQLDRGKSTKDLDDYIEVFKPRLLVLMDNPAINYYRSWQERHPQVPAPPAIALMALFVEDMAKDLKNIVGLDFQPPAVRAIHKLEDLVDHPLERIAVIYQKRYKASFLLEQKLCFEEDINLVGYPISDEADPQKREKHVRASLIQKLKKITKNQQIDGIWVLNDSYLLSSTLLSQVWIPRLASYKKPIIVGAEPLMSFGNFGMFTDFEELGSRVGELADEIRANNWKITNRRTQQPFSPHTIINAGFAARHLGLREEKLVEVDVVINKDPL